MNFGDIPEAYGGEDAAVVLQSIPYDGTSTWGKGANKGFEAFIEASRNMELYDIPTASEPYLKGIQTLRPALDFSSPEYMVDAVEQYTSSLLQKGQLITTFGGEHSITIGLLRAFRQKYGSLSVLQLDAHADLRAEYQGTTFNHACALHESSLKDNLVQVGIRSMDKSEMQFVNNEKIYYAHNLKQDWAQEAISQLEDPVYITLDLDVFDPAIMPSTGTPEPGGLSWEQVTQLLQLVFAQRKVVGFDIVELAPIDHLRAPDMLAAKLYYHMLALYFKYHV